MRLNKLISEHAARVEQASKDLKKLSTKAARLAKVQAKREDLEEKIKDADMQLSACVGTKEALFQEYQRAVFNDDAEQVGTIRGQREVLDEEVSDLRKQVADAEEELSKVAVDGEESATVRALLDSYRTPDYADLLDSIEAELHEASAELNRRVQSAKEQLPPPHLDDETTYTTVRSANDAQYRSERAWLANIARDHERRRAKLEGVYGPGASDTSTIADAHDGIRTKADEVSATSKGELVEGFGKSDPVREGSYDGPSYDEIRAALARE